MRLETLSNPPTEIQTLLSLGQLEQAHQLAKRWVKENPKQAAPLVQLAGIERLRKAWPEAIALMRRALALEPRNLAFTEQLCIMLLYSNVGRNHRELVTHYAAILAQKPDYDAVALNLLTMALRNDLPAEIREAIAPLVDQPNLAQGQTLHYAAACAVAAWLEGDIAAAQHWVNRALAARASAFDEQGKPLKHDRYFMLLYAELVRDLLAFRDAHAALYASDTGLPKLHVIGESHCLAPAHLSVCIDGVTRCTVPHLIMGAKAYFLSLPEQNPWSDALADILARPRRDEPVIVCFGEIDCRPTEGIMEQLRRNPDYAMEAEIARLCEGYAKNVARAARKRTARTYLLGVPAPSQAARKDLRAGEEAFFTGMIRAFNTALARAAQAQSLGFLDLYAATHGENGWAREGVHLDEVHLMPDVVGRVILSDSEG